MTEKRFYTDGQYVMQDGEVYVICNGKHNADVIATALNELIEERNKLQFDYNMEVLTRQSIEKENEQLKSTNMEMEDYLGRLEKENKQLKEENSYLNKELDYYYGRSVMTEKTYTIELIHEDIRREAENYVNQAKAMGFRKDGYGDLMAYVQLIATIVQIEHNNRIKRRIEE